MGETETKVKLGVSRRVIVHGIGLAFLASIFFSVAGYEYDFLSPIERYIGPIFAVTTFFFWMSFIFAPLAWLPGLLSLFKVFAGIVTIIGMVEGALTLNSNVEFYLVWIPVFYVGLIFGATTIEQRHWGIGFFGVANTAVLLALIFGPLSWGETHVIFMLTAILGQLVLVLLLSELADSVRENAATEARLLAAEENAEILRYAAAEAEEANRAKTGFIANMSHEFRTPLNAIIGFSQILQDYGGSGFSDDKRREYAEDIERSAGHLMELVNDILDLSKIEAGKLELANDRVSLSKAFSDAKKMVAVFAQKKRLKLVVDVIGDVPELLADQRCVQQILLNLLSNAIKFTPSEGVIVLLAGTAPDGAIEISLSDTGVGMDRETTARVQQPFEQAQSAYSRKVGGSGLGLPLVKALAQLHDASFSILSEPGSGTDVKITFPSRRSLQTGLLAS